MRHAIKASREKQAVNLMQNVFGLKIIYLKRKN